MLVRQTVRTCGIHGLALTRSSISSTVLTPSEVCTGYMLDGKEIDHLPAGEGAQARIKPVYRDHRGLEGADRQRPVLGGFAGPGH